MHIPEEMARSTTMVTRFPYRSAHIRTPTTKRIQQQKQPMAQRNLLQTRHQEYGETSHRRSKHIIRVFFCAIEVLVKSETRNTPA